MRESPAVDVANLLGDRGAKLAYHDPYVPELKLGEHRLKSTPLDAAKLAEFDMVLITTDHTNVDYKKIVANSRLVFDTRYACAAFKGADNLAFL